MFETETLPAKYDIFNAVVNQREHNAYLDPNGEAKVQSDTELAAPAAKNVLNSNGEKVRE